MSKTKAIKYVALALLAALTASELSTMSKRITALEKKQSLMYSWQITHRALSHEQVSPAEYSETYD